MLSQFLIASAQGCSPIWNPLLTSSVWRMRLSSYILAAGISSIRVLIRLWCVMRMRVNNDSDFVGSITTIFTTDSRVRPIDSSRLLK